MEGLQVVSSRKQSVLASVFSYAATNCKKDYHNLLLKTVATAVALLSRGVDKICLYEKSFSIRPVGAAIGLFPNGFAALRAISAAVVEQRVHASCLPNLRSVVKDLSGTVIRDVDYSAPEHAKATSPTYLVWYLLQRFLAECVDDDENLCLGHTVESFEVQSDSLVSVKVRNRETNETLVRTCKALIGADGIHSAVRTQLFGPRKLNYHGKMMFRAVLDLKDLGDDVCPPTGESMAYMGDEKGKLFAIRETSPDIVTFTSMAVFREPDLRSTPEARRDRLRELFKGYPDEVSRIIDAVDPDAIYENAVYDVDVEKEWSKGPVVLIGDAAHAMTPGLGQGANQGLEDAAELAYALASTLVPTDENSQHEQQPIPMILEAFWRQRFDRVSEVHCQIQG